MRALCDLFGLSIAGAYRYTAAVDQLVDPRLSHGDGERSHATR